MEPAGVNAPAVVGLLEANDLAGQAGTHVTMSRSEMLAVFSVWDLRITLTRNYDGASSVLEVAEQGPFKPQGCATGLERTPFANAIDT